ncbi:MAG: hypothetical protein BGO10_08520 [Chlamydia sp. 32-24]|nr:MAG: hypothetical protein BGO10_08520 [Chlamydia sp. 32-24]
MRPKSIGIVGGAGPLAGAFLLERILSLSNKVYGCYKDSDFPKIFLISFPFSEMLNSNKNTIKLRNELKTCLNQLRTNGADVLAIACNTLHVYLEEADEIDNLIHIPRLLAKEIPSSETPLVLCTSTSMQFRLHKRFFPCNYPDLSTQGQVDEMIDQILRGTDRAIILEKLQKLIETQKEKTIILGCTELSLFATSLSFPHKLIIDPLEIVAHKLLEKSFFEERVTPFC